VFRQETRTSDRQGTERSRGGGQRRTGVPVAAAFVAGYLLRRRLESSGGGETSDVDHGRLAELVSQVRHRTAFSGGEVAPLEALTDRIGSTETAPDEPGADTARATISAAVGTANTERAIAALSAPATRGMPMLGVGTHHHASYDECRETVRQALRTGYRHIDTTVRREAYYNESAVGDAVAAAEVDREDVFVATKVDPADLDARRIRISVEESLDRLGMEYVDMLYPRWPTAEYEAEETLAAFGALHEAGLIERIGVSNFTVELLEEALEVSEKPIFANQVEMHPLFPQEELRTFCARDDVDVELVAYSPLARGAVEDVDEIREVAAKHEASPEQISLAWLREKGVSAVPRATTTAHLRENWLSLGVDLDDEDVATVDSIEERRRIVDPDDAPWNR